MKNRNPSTNDNRSQSKLTLSLFLFLLVAVDKLPNFLAAPTPDDKPGPHHQCSIHLNCESVDVLESAYKDAMNGRPSTRCVDSLLSCFFP